MKLNIQFVIVAGAAVVLTSLNSNAAESAPTMAKPAQPEMAMPDTSKSEMTKPEMTKPEMAVPKAAPVEAPISSPADAPTDATKVDTMPSKTPMAPTAVPEIPADSRSIPMPTRPAAPELPQLKSVPIEPVEPRVSTTSTPAPVSGAAVTTMVLPKETITGIKSVDLPAPPPIQPAYFTLPIIVRVAKDANVVSSTPISDRYTDKASWDVKAWASAVSSCLQQKPKLMRVVGDEEVPFMLNGTEGTIMLNSSDRAVCPM